MGQIREEDFPTPGSGGRSQIPNTWNSIIPLSHLILVKVEHLCAVQIFLCVRGGH